MRIGSARKLRSCKPGSAWKRSRRTVNDRCAERQSARPQASIAVAPWLRSFRKSFSHSKKDECKYSGSAECRRSSLFAFRLKFSPSCPCQQTKHFSHAWAVSGIWLAACCNGLANLRRASKPAREEIETLAIDRLASCPQMIKRGPIGVSVTSLRDRPASAYFGRPVARCSAVVLREKNSATEAIAERIGKLKVSFVGDQDVVGLEVAVIDVARVKGCERACRCVRDGK
jgi:hypothetical protein